MRERKRKQFNQNYKSVFAMGRATMVLVSIGLLFMLGLLYLSQANTIALKGYSLTELETKKAELESEKERLQIEATRLQSIQEIQKGINQGTGGKEKFVPVQKINYLPTTNVAVK